MESTENMGYMQRARNWASDFINRCRYVGILATIYATMGKYDFNKITGLDETKLSTYKANQLENAISKVETMIKYGGWSPDLDQFFLILQTQYQQTLSDEEAAATEKEMAQEANLSYDEEQAVKEIMREKK